MYISFILDFHSVPIEVEAHFAGKIRSSCQGIQVYYVRWMPSTSIVWSRFLRSIRMMIPSWLLRLDAIHMMKLGIIAYLLSPKEAPEIIYLIRIIQAYNIIGLCLLIFWHTFSILTQTSPNNVTHWISPSYTDRKRYSKHRTLKARHS